MFGIDHINIKARDMDGMCDFLIAVLGVKHGLRPDFDFPGHWLYLNEKPIIHIMLSEAGRTQDGWVDHLAFGPCDFERETARLEASSIPYRTSGIPGAGIRQIFVTGPEGAKIELQCSQNHP